MRTLELNNDIRLTDATYRVVGRGGNFYQLKMLRPGFIRDSKLPTRRVPVGV